LKEYFSDIEEPYFGPDEDYYDDWKEEEDIDYWTTDRLFEDLI